MCNPYQKTLQNLKMSATHISSKNFTRFQSCFFLRTINGTVNNSDCITLNDRTIKNIGL